MRLKLPAPLLLGSIVLLACSRIASAHPVDLIPIGYLSYDVTMPGISAVFDITNQTGPNSTPFPDTTWPVTTAASFKISSLTVDFSDGSSTVLGPSYFTLGPDGLSLDGSSLDISGGKPQPTEAVLVGTIANSRITLNDGSNLSVVPPRALVNSTGTGNPVIVHPAGSCCLRDGDSAVIYVATTLPEPVPSDLPIWMLLLTGTLFSRRFEGLSKGYKGRVRFRPSTHSVPRQFGDRSDTLINPDGSVKMGIRPPSSRQKRTYSRMKHSEAVGEHPFATAAFAARPKTPLINATC